MFFYVSIVILVFCGFSATQDEVEREPLSELICQTCSCANGRVDCSDRQIKTPFQETDWEGLSSFNATEVDLSRNLLTSITRFSALPVQNLNLSSCEIEDIENSCFMNLVDLVSLDLSRNKISTPSLSRRMFEGQITAGSPGREPQPFSKMRYLSLAYNDIHSLPQDLFNFMTEVTTLDLSGNPLAYIDPVTMGAITVLTKLKELKLSGCELETLPEGLLRRQRRLEHLDLSNNRFTTVPAVLSEAVNLIYLSLDKNPIENFAEKTAISNLTKLQELRLCRLSKLQNISAGALGGLESLVALHICYNPRLTTINPEALMWEDDHGADKLPVLKQLYLNNNNISEINSHFLERWDQLTDVDFTNNPYVCDCNNQWMVDVLVPLIMSTVANGSEANMFCKKPQDLRGLTFAQLRQTSKTLVCPEGENLVNAPGPDMAILLGIMIGIFVTFPIILVVILLWRKGYCAKLRGVRTRKDYDEEETDAF